MSKQSFESAVFMVDSLAEIDFDSIPYGVRVRPSHPRYFEAICEAANNAREVGVLVSVMREADFFLTYPLQYDSPAPSHVPSYTWRKRLYLFFHGRFREGVGR
jgi:hypothetical protein